MPLYNVIQQTFPDGSYRWKFFTTPFQVGATIENPVLSSSSSSRSPGYTASRKVYENAIRAKQTIYELAKANKDSWTWFVTLTFDPAYVVRDNYRSCLAAIRPFTKSLTYYGSKWLFVPEHHADGHSFHFHGLVGGPIPNLVYAGEHGPNGHRRPTYNVVNFPGFTSVQPVTDPDAVSCYITKYITKDLVALVPPGCHRYLRSRSLDAPLTEYLSLTPTEFASLVNMGEYFPDSTFADAIHRARFVKEVPLYYNGGTMYIVEN